MVVIGAECLRKKHVKSKCSDCIEYCPHQAISLQGNTIKINKSACSECGGCVLSCPVDAIKGLPPVRKIEGAKLFSDKHCPPTMNELLTAYARGMIQIVLAPAHQESWQPAVEKANRALHQLGQPLLSITIDEQQAPEEISLARRSWLRVGHIKKQFTPVQFQPLPLSALFTQHQFFQLTLQTDRCTLCNACVKICPQNCFKLTQDAFTIEAEVCVGCMLCVDLCPENALSLVADISLRQQQQYVLEPIRCSLCQQTNPSFKLEEDQAHHLCPACRFKRAMNLPTHTIGQRSLNEI